MVRTYVCKRQMKYDQQSMQKAMQRVQEGESIYKVSKSCDIPYESLRRWVAKTPRRFRSGSITALTFNEEELIVSALEYCSDFGWPCNRHDLQHMIKSYVRSANIKSRFNINGPGKDYLIAFEKRWKHRLGKRKPEVLTLSRASSLSLSTISNFFNMITDVYNKYNLNNQPNKIFNLDETGFRCTDEKATKCFVRRDASHSFIINPTCGEVYFYCYVLW